MEHIKESPFDATVKIRSTQVGVWTPGQKNNHGVGRNHSGLSEYVPLKDNPHTIGDIHACKNYQHRFLQARNRLRRANRDLGETAALVTASLTTVTAIQAVISIANDKLGLSTDILRLMFDGYIVLLVLIFVWGAFRANSAIRRRARAEREFDQTQKGIFDFCPTDEWPKIEE